MLVLLSAVIDCAQPDVNATTWYSISGTLAEIKTQ